MLMTQKYAFEIAEHKQVQSGIYKLTMRGRMDAKAGQFVQVGVSGSHDPFLPRPLSVHDCQDERLSLLYRLRGRGTAMLAEKKAGEFVRLVGPLGNGFPVTAKQKVIVLAGGIGAAPLYYLIRTLYEAGREIFLFFGAQSAGELFLLDEYARYAHKLNITTDDGSLGTKGFVTDAALPLIRESEADIYACGPEPMLRRIAAAAKDYGRACYISLEAHMACGVGACLGCVVPVRGGNYLRVCADGPVFSASEVYWT